MKNIKEQPSLSIGARFYALANLWPLFAMLWRTSPPLLIGALLLRVLRACLPVALLWVPKLILDQIIAVSSGHGDGAKIWELLSVEMLLALLFDMLARATTLIDSLLGDRFTNYVAIRLMKHSSTLDLAAFEDPVLYDKLERIRNQGRGRLSLLSSLFNVAQEAVTIIILFTGLTVFSPWLIALVAVSLVPTFVGEARFSRMAYSLFFQRTPQRRELDYLRLLGTSPRSRQRSSHFWLGRLPL